jgi:hypothetical protein
MTTPRPSQPSPTRQQLDELEALMQRMLALPLTAPAEDPSAGEMAERSAPSLGSAARPAPVETVRAEPVLVRFSETTPELPVAEMPESRKPSPTEAGCPDEPLPDTELSAGTVAVMAPAVEPTRRTEAVPAGGPKRSVLLEERRARIVAWRQPLLWSNRRFDCWTLRLGGPGRWLRSTQGRAVLGWTGVLLLAAALAWGILDWIGWIW